MTSFAAAFLPEQTSINIALAEATEGLPISVRPVAQHVLAHGGKRLRPLLAVFIARLLGYTPTDIYPLAAAMEMFHAATLLHDDVLDNADLRRGQTAAHRQFGVPQAILCGDALLAQGNQVVASYAKPALTAVASEAIAKTAGGEILEIESQGIMAPNLINYLEIIGGKTAWLIRASCEIGALQAGAAPDQIEAATGYGYNLGMAFQLVDDALDFAPSIQTGKPEGGDVREGKCTPPVFFYAASLPDEERIRFNERFAARSFTDEDVHTITDAIRKQKFDEQTRKIADTYLQRAQDALESLTARVEYSTCQDILKGFIGHVRHRTA